MAATAGADAASDAYLTFHPVGVQPPLCRLFQHSTPDRFCPLTADECPYLHIKEGDGHPPDAASASPNDRCGVPFNLFRLAIGEEAPFSLLRRTLEQHGDGWVHRTRNLRHTLLHWTQSCPAPSVAAILRPDCRILHFPHFTHLTHKHRWQSCVRKQNAKLAVVADAIQASDPERAHRLRHVLDFYPITLLLPSDRLQLLQLHESLGGQVDEQLRQEALHPSGRSHKEVRKEKRRNVVGDVIIRGETDECESLSPSPSPTTPSASAPEGSDDASEALSSSPSAAATDAHEAPLWLSFEVPDFLAEYPLHFGVPAEPCAASSADAVAVPAVPASSSPVWILKPYSRGSGHGIRVTDLKHNVMPEWITGQFVATAYVQRPLLIERTSTAGAAKAAKAARRAAATAAAAASSVPDVGPVPAPVPAIPAVPAASPQLLFLHREGLARFASAPYDDASLGPDRLGTRMDAFTHLTNSAINISNGARGEKERGCWQNWSMATLRNHFDTQRAVIHQATSPVQSSSSSPPYAWDWSYVWSQVRHVVVHSLCASDAYLRSGLDRNNAHSFELLGFDLLVDEEFKVHLCEINSMPDLNNCTPLTQYHQTYPCDHEVKSYMLADLFTALRFERPNPNDATATTAAPPSSSASAAQRVDEKAATNGSTDPTAHAHAGDSGASRDMGGFERLI